MPGVGMKITTWDRIPLGIGSMDLDSMDTMENLMLDAPSSIEALGQQIVAEESSDQIVAEESSDQIVADESSNQIVAEESSNQSV